MPLHPIEPFAKVEDHVACAVDAALCFLHVGELTLLFENVVAPDISVWPLLNHLEHFAFTPHEPTIVMNLTRTLDHLTSDPVEDDGKDNDYVQTDPVEQEQNNE